MRHFFVTGLPRSRTGWMSVMLTGAYSICLHDVMREAETMCHMRDILEREPAAFTGASDSGIPLSVEPFDKVFPRAPVVIVERPFGEVLDSCARTFRGPKDHFEAQLKRCEAGLQTLAEVRSPLTVKWTDLDDEGAMREVWSHLIPGAAFPLRRWRYTKTLKVDLMVDNYLRSVTTSAVQRN